MGDAGFFRGTSSDQDGRFSDKEKKLLKQMKFEDALEKKINIERINLDVIKPWITMRINEILGMEDDVVIEYIMSQLEEKTINPKIMQINITGFLNARRAREFMGELWKLLVEGDEAEDGIPRSLVEKKMSDMKKETGKNGDNKPPIVALAQNDWANRYQTLSLGRFSGPTSEKAVRDDRLVEPGKRSPRRNERERSRSPKRGRDETPPRRKDYDEREKKRIERHEEEKRKDEERRRRRADEKERERRKELERERERKRDDERRDERRRREERRRHSRSRSRSPVRRRFTEGSSSKKRKRSSLSSDDEVAEKKKKKRSRYSSDDDEDERRHKKEKKSKKHKKEKKKKERKRSPTPSTASDTE